MSEQKEKKVAILQSNYIPWKGYFDIINLVDEFIFYDTAQYTKNDWRNRNLIKTPNGLQWLTIPVSVKTLDQKINETTIAQNNWKKKHIKTIIQNYSKSNYFEKFFPYLEKIYSNLSTNKLSEINYEIIKNISEYLGIQTKLSWSSDYNLVGGKTDKLVSLCKQANAKVYLSGPAARNYLDESFFTKEGIKVEWMDYSGYPEYNQLFPPFEHGVSIIDLIFNEGPRAKDFMKSFNV